MAGFTALGLEHIELAKASGLSGYYDPMVAQYMIPFEEVTKHIEAIHDLCENHNYVGKLVTAIDEYGEPVEGKMTLWMFYEEDAGM